MYFCGVDSLYIVSIGIDHSISVACRCNQNIKCPNAIRMVYGIKKYQEKIPKYYSMITKHVKITNFKIYDNQIAKYEKYKYVRKFLFLQDNHMFINFITDAYFIECKRLEIINTYNIFVAYRLTGECTDFKYIICSRKLAELYYIGCMYKKSYNKCISTLKFINDEAFKTRRHYRYHLKFRIYNILANIHTKYYGGYYNLIKAKHYINLGLKDKKDSKILKENKKKINVLISMHHCDIDEKKESMYKTSKHIFKIKIVSLINNIEYPRLFNYHHTIRQIKIESND